MTSRLKPAIVSILLQGTLGYALVMALVVSRADVTDHRLTTVNVTRIVPVPPPAAAPKLPASLPVADRPVVLHDWAAAGPEQRNLDFMRARKWVNDNLSEEERRLAKWREAVPQGSGGAKVTRLRPDNLATHTLYWPADWTKGPLPVIGWGNGKCTNNSLPYAAFLSEIASHGYFVVAVGNDDIDYPQPEGLEVLADGRPFHTQASALTRAVDWAVTENGRSGSPFKGRIDTGRIAYMGHDCGGSQALIASSDPRTTAIVLLNGATRFATVPSGYRKPPLAEFAGERNDETVRDVDGDNLAKAQAEQWPMLRATSKGSDHNGAYFDSSHHWSRAVLAWLDWQLKGRGGGEALTRSLKRSGWDHIATIGLQKDIPEK